MDGELRHTWLCGSCGAAFTSESDLHDHFYHNAACCPDSLSDLMIERQWDLWEKLMESGKNVC